MQRFHSFLILLIALFAAALSAQITPPFLASGASASAGQTGNGATGVPGATFGPNRVSSDDGRYVLMRGGATDLVPGQSDGNASTDIFLLDQFSGTIKLVSHAAGSATQACNAGTGSASVFCTISADGAWVCFNSSSTDLVSGVADSNGVSDVFLYETATGTVTLVSRTAASATITGNNVSTAGLVDGTGRYVAYLSTATDLLAGLTETNSVNDIYMYDRVTGVTRLVSHAAGSTTTTGTVPSGTSGSNLQMFSDAGSLVYTTECNNIGAGVTDANTGKDLYHYDIASDTNTLITHPAAATATAAGGSNAGLISADGNYVVYHHYSNNIAAGQVDTNGNWDVFLWSRATNSSVLVSHVPGSAVTASTTTTVGSGPPLPAPIRIGSLSTDGRYIAYMSDAKDLVTGQSIHASQSAFTSNAFVFDRVTGSNTLVSHVSSSATASGSGYDPWVSPDGDYVIFTSVSDSMVSGVTDTNGARDTFLFRRSSGANQLVSRTQASATNTGNATGTSATWGGGSRQVFFSSSASDMGPTDGNATTDVFGVSIGVYVASVTPASGPTTGGNTISFTGRGFAGLTAILIDGATAGGLTITSDTGASMTAPAHSAGVVDIQFVTPFMTETRTAAYTYATTPAPAVSGVSPGSGSVNGGTSVTITGTGFTAATSVTFGGTGASFTVVSATQISATSPAHAAGAVSVVVTTPAGSNGANTLFTYTANAPTVTGVSPSTGSTNGGTSVTITGTSFSGATSVTFGSVGASFSVISATQINAATPAHSAGAVSVVVTTPAGTSGANSLFSYVAPPTLTLVSPASAPTAGGTSVTLTGTGFTGATSVSFGSVSAAFTVNSNSSITATTPAHAAGFVSVIVTSPYGSNAANSAFEYIAAPTVTNVSPASGSTSGGTAITITGTNFVGVSGATLGGLAATGVTVVSTTSITCTTPAHAAATVSVEVTTSAGTSAANSLFTYFVPAVPPEIELTRAGNPIAAGGADSAPTVVAGAGFTLTYTFSNLGGLDLTLATPVTVTGAINCTVTVTQQPASLVAGGGSTSLMLQATPTAAGAFSFNVSVGNNDASENPYNWSVSGVATTAGGGGGGGNGGGGGGCASGTCGATLWLIGGLLFPIVCARRRRQA